MTQNPSIEELLDREAIRAVLARYCRAIDRLDAELLETVYHPGALEHHGAFRGDAETWRKRALKGIPENLERMRHLLGSTMIELDGDVAHAETYFTAGCVLRERSEGNRLLRVIDGRYVDRFERRNGDWRIVRRTVVKDYTNVRVLNDPEEPYPMSQWGRDDPVYQLR
jgi:hypothetical protein